jgi:hypothetical protein
MLFDVATPMHMIAPITCYTLFFVPVMYSLLRRKAPAEPVDEDTAAEPADTPLPGNWASTANALEGLAHAAKDAVTRRSVRAARLQL